MLVCTVSNVLNFDKICTISFNVYVLTKMKTPILNCIIYY